MKPTRSHLAARCCAAATLTLVACGGSQSSQDVDYADEVAELCDSATLDDNADADEVADSITELLDDIDALGEPDLDADQADALDDFINKLDRALGDFDELDNAERDAFWSTDDGAEALADAQDAADEAGIRPCKRFADDYLEANGEIGAVTTTAPPAETTPPTLSLPDETVPANTSPATVPATTPPASVPSGGYPFTTGLPELLLPAEYTYFPYDSVDDSNVDLFLEGTTLAEQLAVLRTGAFSNSAGEEVGRLWVGESFAATMPDEWLVAMCQADSVEVTTPLGFAGIGCTIEGTTFYSVTLDSIGFTTRAPAGSPVDAASLLDAIIQANG